MAIIDCNNEAKAYLDRQPTANTVVYLPLNGDTTAYGSFTGSVNLGSDIAWETITGNVKGIRFKGNTNSYIQITGVPELNTDFTFNFRIYLYNTSDPIMIERGIRDSTNQDLHYIVRSSSRKVDLGFYSNDCAGNVAVNTGVWYNFMGTYKYSTREMKTYINGVLDGTRTGSGNPSFGTGALYLGCKKSYANSNPTNWIMARFVWENRIRSAQEGVDYYNKVKSKLWL